MKVRLLLTGAAIALSGAIPGVARAQPPACDASLLGVPFEAAVLPEGFAWQQLTFGLYGWSGAIDRVDPTVEYPPSITLGAWCASDPALLLRRLTEISDALDVAEAVPIATIGDGSVAVRDGNGVMTIWWTNGNLVASIRPWGVRSEAFALRDLEAIASALSVTMATSDP